jgi:galactokinase
MIDAARVRSEFEARHGGGARLFHAPGRVNLIGEHTDYNDGFVLPMAIDRGTTVAARVRADRLVTATSVNNGETLSFDLDRPGPPRRGTWQDYVEGVAQALGPGRLRGADLVLWGDVPAGAGLSSSAAIEVAVGLSLLILADVVEPDADGLIGDELATELALAAQRAEHQYVGTRCGIMDQLISARGRRDHALLIDCRSLEATPVPLELPDALVLICDSQVKHELASSAYNERRAQCEEAVRVLGAHLSGVRALRDVSEADLERHQGALPEPIRARARHVVGENARTLRACAALRAGDLEAVGREMYASHASLRDDYQVSCAELDHLVELARAVPGVLGARMTGGGFGGCTVNLVRRAALPEVERRLVEGYRARFGRAPELFVSRAAGGARALS